MIKKRTKKQHRQKKPSAADVRELTNALNNPRQYEAIITSGVTDPYTSVITRKRTSDEIFEEARREQELDYQRELQLIKKENSQEGQDSSKLKSLHLVTASLEPPSVIFLVLDKRFETPVRLTVKNKQGNDTYIKKLYNIAYIANAPGKKVDYNKNLADNINNGLFKIAQVSRYMKTNNFKKPTLVKKSENNTLVLKGEVIVKTGLIEHVVPTQHKFLYIDKTR